MLKFYNPTLSAPLKSQSVTRIWSLLCTSPSSSLGRVFSTSMMPFSLKLSTALLSGAILSCTWKIACCMVTFYPRNRRLKLWLSQVQSSLRPLYLSYSVRIANGTCAIMPVIIMAKSKENGSGSNIFAKKSKTRIITQPIYSYLSTVYIMY